ncbi:outer membrane protein [Chitinophaga costaii]|uniref:Outer membrane protein n=1 Tax=Chitinophaga costaii TaxID=1335309 RepID=A0A1C4FQR3_9BACT|nr:TolC family protein [Chitinophaga costaii]PUZ20472.1 TolC family protein [Chitinophaga costaii]SCC58329.1 outer membrane protein [Chitinophaga costaii]
MFCINLVRHRIMPARILPLVWKIQLALPQLYSDLPMKLFTPASIGLLILLQVASVQPAAAQIADSTRTWTLQESVDYAMQHNITIKQQDVTKRFAELTYQQSKLAQVPTVVGNVSENYNLGRTVDLTSYEYVNKGYFATSANFQSSATLFNWFSARNRIAGNRFEAQANNFLLEKARNDIALNIAQAFLQILLNNEQVHISENQLKLTNSQLENTRKQVIAGAVPESNQADLEAQQARDSSTLVSAQTTAIVSVLQMKALLNLGFDQPYVPQIPGNIADIPMPHLTELSPEMVFSAAQSTYPLIRADQLRIKEYDKLVKSARGSLFPTIGLSGYWGSNYSAQAMGKFGRQFSDNFQQTYAAGLNIPILNGWQLRTNYNKSKLNLEQQKLTTDADNQQLREDIYTAYANAVGSLQKYNAASRTVEASQRAFDFAGKRYELGLMNTIDFITTQSNLFRAQIDKVSALYDYIFKMKLLEFYRDQHISL